MDCQRLQEMKPGYEFKGNIHVYYIISPKYTNLQELRYRCRCDYCFPEMFPGPRSEKRTNLLDEL